MLNGANESNNVNSLNPTNMDPRGRNFLKKNLKHFFAFLSQFHATSQYYGLGMWGNGWSLNTNKTLYNYWSINSLRPSDAIWHDGSPSTLVQIMACCLREPSHYLNQCWLIINRTYSKDPCGKCVLYSTFSQIKPLLYPTIANKFQWNYSQNTTIIC